MTERKMESLIAVIAVIMESPTIARITIVLHKINSFCYLKGVLVKIPFFFRAATWQCQRSFVDINLPRILLRVCKKRKSCRVVS